MPESRIDLSIEELLFDLVQRVAKLETLMESQIRGKNTIYIILGSMISAVVGGLVSYFGHFTTSH